jgi:TolB protein
MDVDDRIRDALRRLGPPESPSRWLDRVRRRRNRIRLVRHVQVGTLAITVVAGSLGGVWALNEVFGSRIDRAGRGGGTGEVGFVRTVRACPGDRDEIGPDSELFVASADGTRERTISEHSKHGPDLYRGEQQPDWSPDGFRIAWVDRYLKDLFVTDGEGRHLARLTHGMSVSLPEWSPSGDLIAFSGTDAGGWRSHIYAIDPDGERLIRLTSGEDVTDWSPTWSPDGSRIAFLRSVVIRSVERGTTSIEYGPPSLYVMNRDGGDVREMMAAPDDVEVLNGEWSPDGERFVGEAVVDGNHDIYVIDIAEETLRRLTDDPSEDQSPSWSPDGDRIVFSARVDGQREILVMDADGTSVVRVTDNCWVDYEPTWLPSFAGS